jgi:two-component system cell cycle sensor histidine kinase/response regulator CckA
MAKNPYYQEPKQRLIELEKRYRDLFNSISDLIMIHDLEGRLLDVNPAVCQLSGYKSEELIGRPISDFIIPKFRPLFQDEYLKEIEKQGYAEGVVIFQAKDEKEHYVEYRNALVKQKGREPYVSGLGRDITDRKQAEEALQKAYEELEQRILERTADLVKTNEQLKWETKERKQVAEALRESQERYALATHAAGVGVWDWNLQTNTFYLDPNVKEILGYSDSEIPNELDVWSEYVHPEDKQSVMETFQAHLDGKTPEFVFEHRMIHKDGSLKWIMARGTAMRDDQGNPIRVVGTDTDITARKQAEDEKKKLEEQVQQAQKLEAIGTLAGGIAHAFNNLLMAIQGNTSLLLCDMDSCHPYFDALKNIENSVRNGAKLTNQLLGYARKGKYRVEPVKLNQLVEETADAVGRTRKEIIIHRKLSEDLLAIEAEQGQIEQVLLNLYINAADSMPNGGKIIVRTLNVSHEDMRRKLYDPKPGNYVQLTVTDSGLGMDKRTQKRIFEPFFTTKGMGRGTGLGLASVYGIVKSHGGYIEVESEKGHGTAFSIFLPACSIEIPKTINSSNPIIEGSGTILLVDDEEIVLEAGIKMLERLGYSVLKAGSGTEAVEIYKDNKETIDLVILDMIMPGVGGGETYDRMKKINPTVKVLLSSGYSADGQAAEILKRGCKDFIQKPFNLNKLSTKVKEILVNR